MESKIILTLPRVTTFAFFFKKKLNKERAKISIANFKALRSDLETALGVRLFRLLLNISTQTFYNPKKLYSIGLSFQTLNN